MARDEAADGPGGDHHEKHRDDDRGDHDGDLVHHADGRNDGVEREHEVDNGDLDEHAGEAARQVPLRAMLFALHEAVDLPRCLPDEEGAAREQDDVAAGDLLAQHGEHGRREAHQPGEREQQADAHEHGEPEADAPRELAPLRRQAIDQDRDEDDVVDAEHELERSQREESDPRLRIGQEFHRGLRRRVYRPRG